MQINCVKCSSPLAAEDVNIPQAIGKCSNCQAVFHLGEAQRKRDPVRRPRRFSVTHAGSEVLIGYRRSWPVAIFMLVFSLFWNGVTWTGITMMYLEGQVQWFFPLFITPFVLIGLATAYTAAAYLVNSTTIRAAPSLLKVSHGPLPWFGNRSLDPAQIEQFSSHERLHQGKHGTTKSYEVIAHMIGGEQIKVITGLEKPSFALYLEQELEAGLAIDDRQMPDELSR